MVFGNVVHEKGVLVHGGWFSAVSCTKKGVLVHGGMFSAASMGKRRREGIRMYEFLRGPPEDAFGEGFYSALSAAARMLMAAS